MHLVGIRRLFGALLFSFLVFGASLFVPQSASAVYNVSGCVYDNKTGQGIPGYVNSSIYIYPDNTQSQFRATPDGSGCWHILGLSDGYHSIEIANAGSMGWGPASPEKVTVTGSQTVSFRINRGYDVVGRVANQNGAGVSGVTIYSDFPGTNQTYTDSNGNYRIVNLMYGGNGHTIYARPDNDSVLGQDYQVVNPSQNQTEVSVNFTTGGYFPTTPTAYANCTVSVLSTSGSNSPVYITLQGNFSSNNLSVYYPSRYDWDYNGDGIADNTTNTSSTSATSPQGTLTAYSSTNTFRPKLKVYYQNSGNSVECATNQTVTVYPQNTGNSGNTFANCTLQANQTSGNSPFASRFTGTFIPASGGSSTPNRYRFFVDNQDRSVLSNYFSQTLDYTFNSTGTFPTRLEISHSGGVATCTGPTITVNQGTTTNPGVGTPYCSVSASPNSGTVPFTINLNGSFYNQGGSYYTPNRYRFYVGSDRESVSTNQSSTSTTHYQTVPGSHLVRLEVRHEGGTTTCSGNTVNAYNQSGVLYNSSYQNYTILGASTTVLPNTEAVVTTPPPAQVSILGASPQATVAIQEIEEEEVEFDGESRFGELLAHSPNTPQVTSETNPQNPFAGFFSMIQNFLENLI